MSGTFAALRSSWGLVAAVVLSAAAYGGMVAVDATTGTLRGRSTPWTIALYLLAVAGFVVALWWNERRGIPWRWLWLVPLVFRLVLLFTTPTLSDDVYRYLWDGHVATQGVNPYGYTLDDARLDQYEIEARALANNPTFGTPYLPAAQLVFAGSALVLPSEPWTMQAVMVAFDVAAALLIVVLLGRAGLPRSRVMLYLWNPLVIVEVAHSAHLDAAMIALALLAVALSIQREHRGPGWAAPVALALATLTRPLPLLLLPVLWWRWSWSQRTVLGVSLAAILVPFGVTAGWGLTGEVTRTGVFGSSRAFVQEVSFNSGVFHWVRGWLEQLGAADPVEAARLVVGVVLAALVVAVWRRAKHVDEPRHALRLMAVPLMGYVVLTSILHPWYLLILVALLPFLTPAADEPARRWWWLAPWIYLGAAVGFSYLTYRDPARFGELEWVRRLEWYPSLVLLVVVATWAWRSSVAASAGRSRPLVS